MDRQLLRRVEDGCSHQSCQRHAHSVEVAYVTKDRGAKALIGSPKKVEPAGATPFAALIGDHTEFDPETFSERRRRRDASPPSLAGLDD
jgi:hypothetical protein